MKIYSRDKEWTEKGIAEKLTDKMVESYIKDWEDAESHNACLDRPKSYKFVGFKLVAIPSKVIFIKNGKIIVCNFDEDDEWYEVYECDTLEEFIEMLK